MNNSNKYKNNLNLIGPIIKSKRIEKMFSLEKVSNKLKMS